MAHVPRGMELRQAEDRDWVAPKKRPLAIVAQEFLSRPLRRLWDIARGRRSPSSFAGVSPHIIARLPPEERLRAVEHWLKRARHIHALAPHLSHPATRPLVGLGGKLWETPTGREWISALSQMRGTRSLSPKMFYSHIEESPISRETRSWVEGARALIADPEIEPAVLALLTEVIRSRWEAVMTAPSEGALDSIVTVNRRIFLTWWASWVNGVTEDLLTHPMVESDTWTHLLEMTVAASLVAPSIETLPASHSVDEITSPIPKLVGRQAWLALLMAEPAKASRIFPSAPLAAWPPDMTASDFKPLITHPDREIRLIGTRLLSTMSEHRSSGSNGTVKQAALSLVLSRTVSMESPQPDSHPAGSVTPPAPLRALKDAGDGHSEDRVPEKILVRPLGDHHATAHPASSLSRKLI